MKRERGYSLVAYHLCVFRGLNTHREGIYLDWYKVLFANTIFYFLQYCELGEQTKMDKIRQIKCAPEVRTDPIFWFVNWHNLKTAHHNIPRDYWYTSTTWCLCAFFYSFYTLCYLWGRVVWVLEHQFRDWHVKIDNIHFSLPISASSKIPSLSADANILCSILTQMPLHILRR